MATHTTPRLPVRVALYSGGRCVRVDEYQHRSSALDAATRALRPTKTRINSRSRDLPQYKTFPAAFTSAAVWVPDMDAGTYDVETFEADQ